MFFVSRLARVAFVTEAVKLNEWIIALREYLLRVQENKSAVKCGRETYGECSQWTFEKVAEQFFCLSTPHSTDFSGAIDNVFRYSKRSECLSKPSQPLFWNKATDIGILEIFKRTTAWLRRSLVLCFVRVWNILLVVSLTTTWEEEKHKTTALN